MGLIDNEDGEAQSKSAVIDKFGRNFALVN